MHSHEFLISCLFKVAKGKRRTFETMMHDKLMMYQCEISSQAIPTGLYDRGCDLIPPVIQH